MNRRDIFASALLRVVARARSFAGSGVSSSQRTGHCCRTRCWRFDGPPSVGLTSVPLIALLRHRDAPTPCHRRPAPLERARSWKRHCLAETWVAAGRMPRSAGNQIPRDQGASRLRPSDRARSMPKSLRPAEAQRIITALFGGPGATASIIALRRKIPQGRGGVWSRTCSPCLSSTTSRPGDWKHIIDRPHRLRQWSRR